MYIRLTADKHELSTHVVDDWVAVDIGSDRKVVGFEILEASTRLDLEYLKTINFVEYGEPVIYDPDAGLLSVRETSVNYESDQNASEGSDA